MMAILIKMVCKSDFAYTHIRSSQAQIFALNFLKAAFLNEQDKKRNPCSCFSKAKNAKNREVGLLIREIKKKVLIWKHQI